VHADSTDDIGDNHKVLIEVYDYDLMGSAFMCVKYMALDDMNAQHKFLRILLEPEAVRVDLRHLRKRECAPTVSKPTCVYSGSQSIPAVQPPWG
jgi:hypothetical protein